MNQHYFTEGKPLTKADIVTREIELQGNIFSVATAPQVFSHRRLDLGTRVFLDRVPTPPPTGVFLDIGCGWGPLTLALATASPEAQVYAVDINPRARELTQRNLRQAKLTNATVCCAEDVPEKLDLIWSNPPVRIGKEALHNLLFQWLPRLDENGVAHLVVQRNLGADSLVTWLNSNGFQAGKTASAKGYRIISVTHPK